MKSASAASGINRRILLSALAAPAVLPGLLTAQAQLPVRPSVHGPLPGVPLSPGTTDQQNRRTSTSLLASHSEVAWIPSLLPSASRRSTTTAPYGWNTDDVLAPQQSPVCCAIACLRSCAKNGFRTSGRPLPSCSRPDSTITLKPSRIYFAFRPVSYPGIPQGYSGVMIKENKIKNNEGGDRSE
jgi:hypothetical protein